jgi:hypothetical protein
MKDVGKITVVNVKTATDFYYVGRNVKQYGSKTVLGNVFHITSWRTRAQVVQEYREWIWRELNLEEKYGVVSEMANELKALARRVKAGEDIALGCHCAPEECHADVIKAAIRYLIVHEIV